MQKNEESKASEEITEEEELVALKKMRDESIKKFKEMFPNGATVESGEFLE